MNNKNEQIESLNRAVSAGNSVRVEFLIKNGADVHGVVVGAGYQPTLNLASREGHVDVVKILIKNGASVNAVDNCGYKYTPLHQACKKGHIKVAKLLIAEGANLDATDSNGKTPLHLVFKKGYSEIAKLLINKGANVNAADNYKILPLLLADFYHQTKLANLLRERGAEILPPDDNGITLLNSIYNEGNIKVAKLLIGAILLKNLAEKKSGFIQENQELSDYWDKHKLKLDSEVSSLKKITFGKQLSLYDFYVTRNSNKLMEMSRNKAIKKIMTAEDFTKKYPFFGSKAKENFEKGFARNKIFNAALNSIYCRTKLLPLECWEKVLKNLDAQSLKNVTNIALLFFKPTPTISELPEMTDTCNYLSQHL